MAARQQRQVDARRIGEGIAAREMNAGAARHIPRPILDQPVLEIASEEVQAVVERRLGLHVEPRRETISEPEADTDLVSASSGNTNIGLTLNLKFPVLMVSADSATPKSCAPAVAGASTATTAAIKASHRKSTLPSFARAKTRTAVEGATIVPVESDGEKGEAGSQKLES